MLEYEYEDPSDGELAKAPIPPIGIKLVEMDDVHGVFISEPMERGFGTTIGNPLRRVLLSSIAGAAVTWIRIDGVDHEYSTIPAVKEDMIDLLLNIKSVNLKALSSRSGKLRLEVEGEGNVSAGDIMTSPDFQVINPEQHIATLDGPKSRLEVEMNVENGKGYVPAAQLVGLPIGVLPVDAIFTPVRKVNYTVEQMRVGQRTDFERLRLEIWTNGAVTPLEALRDAAHELVEHFFRFSNLTEKILVDGDAPTWLKNVPAAQYNMALESLALSVRTLNCLKRASINKVGELLEKDPSELLTIRNFGIRSLDELKEKLFEHGISYGDKEASEEVDGSSDGTEALQEVGDLGPFEAQE